MYALQHIKSYWVLAIALLSYSSIWGHPTGNMIVVDNQVFWSYIHPIDDALHHACIMVWENGSTPQVFLKSEYPASDFMLYAKGQDIYILERRYLQASDTFEIRLLKTTKNQKPTVLWEWFEDQWHIGEAGFFMLSDTQMVFGKYPSVYKLQKGKQPSVYFEFETPINRIRALPDDTILLLGDTSCFLATQTGSILQEWNNIIEPKITNAPLDRNKVFDVDFQEGQLLMAYWGRRSFEMIDAQGNKHTLYQHIPPFTPHWVAFMGKDQLLFASELTFNGSTPKPNLIKLSSTGRSTKIW
ncbi:hypothetical protein [Mangrovimonas sp. DI 80]|uniref:hypothetical protein n=1 Tax=Mangrovimonas sp. DI 80 TaxID=1779330 RepID=UPI00097635D6|nr:hypothetical protein [Mangrovimonas sp. DI 80]OMP32339.1 hypothetical protein BKM32_04620 [Mangrovimonas sp. DI 80]